MLKRGIRPLLVAATGSLCAALALALPCGQVELRVDTVEGGTPLLSARLSPGQTFTLRYNHSVDGTPVWEVHRVDREGRIFVEEERFVMVGAGMGDLPGRGTWGGGAGTQSIRDLHYPISDFVLRVGSPGVDHTILWHDGAMNLSERAAGRAVRVTARPLTVGGWLRSRVWPEAPPREAGESG